MHSKLSRPRPRLQTPVHVSLTSSRSNMQDYIDSMEGATLSGRQCAGAVLEAAPQLAAAGGAGGGH